MRTSLLLLAAVWLATMAVGSAMEPIVIIKSPDEAKSFIYGDVSQRKLKWSDKEKKLYALITVDNSRYATQNERRDAETVKFWLPGVQYDPARKLYFVLGRAGEPIPFAETKKELLFETIAPVRNAVVRVIRTRGRIEVVAEIYKPADVAAAEAEQKNDPSRTNEWQKLDLDRALGY